LTPTGREKAMGLLGDKEKEHVKKEFKQLRESVKIVMFTQEFECEYCRAVRDLLEDVAGLSDRISLEVLDFVKDREKAGSYGIDKIPAFIVMGEKDYGIRFYGVPAGYEFPTLIEDIIDVSRREHGLPGDVTGILSKVEKPVHLQVIISPT
jgi:glutaredoxin-like protein